MALNRLAKIRVAERPVQRQLDALIDRGNELGEKEIVDSRIIQGIELTNGILSRIKHGLNRTLIGWFVIRIGLGGSDSEIHDLQDLNEQPETELHLLATGFSDPVTISIVVF